MKTYKTEIDEIRLKKVKSVFLKAKINSSIDAQEFARQFFYDDLTIYESFFLILLNSQNNTIGYAKISQGGISGTVVDPLIIAKYAIDTMAKGVILVHNHPSGNENPSKADKKATKQIKKALKLFNCNVIDHLIITEESFFSFSDNEIL